MKLVRITPTAWACASSPCVNVERGPDGIVCTPCSLRLASGKDAIPEAIHWLRLHKVVEARSLEPLRLFRITVLGDIAEFPRGLRAIVDSDNLRHNRAPLPFLEPERERSRTAPTQPCRDEPIVPLPGICFA